MTVVVVVILMEAEEKVIVAVVTATVVMISKLFGLKHSLLGLLFASVVLHCLTRQRSWFVVGRDGLRRLAISLVLPCQTVSIFF